MKSTKHRRLRPSEPARAMIAPLVIRSDGTFSQEYTEKDRRFFRRWQPTTIGSEKDAETLETAVPTDGVSIVSRSMNSTKMAEASLQRLFS